MVCQTGFFLFFFKDNLHLDVNNHTTVLQTGFNRVLLNPVCETVVYSLTFRVENVFEKKF